MVEHVCLEDSRFCLESGRAKAAEALRSRYPSIERLYLGSLAVLCCSDNPERFEQGAHSLREAIDGLAFEVTGQDRNEFQVKESANKVGETWKNADQGISLLLAGSGGPIEESVRNAIQEASDFFQEVRAVSSLSQYYSSLATLLQQTSAAGRRWHALYRYFAGICHHDKKVDESEFIDRLEELEVLMIQGLAPVPFANQDALSQIIAEGEGA